MRIAMTLVLALTAAPLAAQDMSVFQPGPVLTEFGAHAPVPGVDQLPADTEFSVAFDISAQATDGKANRGFDSAARFLNMHVAHGVKEENIRLAVVVHGKAGFDLLNDAAYAEKTTDGGDTNPSRALVDALLEHDVRFIICGQSAAALGIKPDDLLPGVEMALSAMTAFALLQQNGFTVNPF